MPDNWDWDNYIREVDRTVGQRVQAAGIYLVGRVRENLSVPGTARAAAKLIRGGKTYRKGRRVYGADRSKPGEFPRKQFGALRQSVATDFEAEKLTARVGSPSKVAKFLELGTRTMKPRALFRVTLIQERQNIADMILRPPSK